MNDPLDKMLELAADGRLVHDFIDPERNGSKRRSLCGVWVPAQTIDAWQTGRAQVTCPICKARGDAYEKAVIK